MREIYIDSKEAKSYSSLWFLLFGIIIAFFIGFSPINNIFWYKTAFLFYIFSSLMYLYYFFSRSSIVGRFASLTFFATLSLNLGALISRAFDSYKEGLFHPPWSDLFEALTFWSFIVGCVYLFIEKKYGYKLIGSLVSPVITFIYGFSILYANPNIEPLMPALRSYWLYIHVLTAFIGYAGFTVAFAGASFYLLKKNFPSLSKNLPSEEILDEITYKSIAIVFPIWTASIILGAAWANEAWGGYWSWDPKEVWALIVWLFFGAYLHARHLMGWKGKRVAWMVVLGFIMVLICFFAINLYFPGLHSYAKS